MLEQLRAWLNGARDYQQGVGLYYVVGDNLQYKGLFIKGKTDFTYKLLQDELMAICLRLKNTAAGSAPAATTATDPGPVNAALYEASRKEANIQYKAAMNSRAVLFRMATAALTSLDPNTDEQILARQQLAVDVVNNYNEASALYDRADYVKKHGKLPDEAVMQPEEEKTDVADVMVFYTLCNSRKYYNKMKARRDTAKNVAKMQQYQERIKELENRWQLLKQQYEQ